MAQEVVLGIDIGGSPTKIGFVARDGTILNKTIFKTYAKKPFPKFMEKLKVEVETLISKLLSEIQICSIGVGAPNINPHTGQIENPPNLNWGKPHPFPR